MFWISNEAITGGKKVSNIVVNKDSKSILYANSHFKMPEKPKKKDEDKSEDDEDKKEEAWNLEEASKDGRILIGHMTLLTGDGKKDSLKVFSQEYFKIFRILHSDWLVEILISDWMVNKKF